MTHDQVAAAARMTEPAIPALESLPVGATSIPYSSKLTATRQPTKTVGLDALASTLFIFYAPNGSAVAASA